MKAKLARFADFFYIIESQSNNQRIGVVRLDKQTQSEYIVSIFIDPQFYGKGYAKASLKYLDLLHPNITIKATVLVENSASQHLFLAANYQRISPDTFIRSTLIQERQ
jgi:RimJ/RimL family protein N-acetyltransferase